MSTNHWATTILAAAALVWLGLAVSIRSIAFQDVEHAKEEIEAAGYYCSSDRYDGKVERGGFLVSKERMSWEMVNGIRKIGKMGPEWQKMAWVTAGDSQLGILFSAPDGADVRAWGNVYIVGECAVLNEIEASLRNSQRRN